MRRRCLRGGERAQVMCYRLVEFDRRGQVRLERRRSGCRGVFLPSGLATEKRSDAETVTEGHGPAGALSKAYKPGHWAAA